MTLIRASNLLHVFFLLNLVACASPRVNPFLSQQADTKLTQAEFNKGTQTANALWPERYKKASLEKFIRLEEQLAHSSFQTREGWALLARAHYFYAEYHVTDWAEKTRQWELGADWAEVALHRGRPDHAPPEQYLHELDTLDVPALYWYAANLGKWTQRQGLNTILKYKAHIKKMIDRVEELSPDYLYGAVQRYNGVYYALLPGYTEEDLKKSRTYFEEAIKKHPDYFANRVYFAEFYAKKMDEKKIYNQQLQIVIHGNALKHKEVYPEQILEQARAKKLLETPL
jgi:hypothetical protein